jgi:hypothetical protein
MENEGDFYALAIINLYVKDEMIYCWDHQTNNYVPNLNKDQFKQKN